MTALSSRVLLERPAKSDKGEVERCYPEFM
jgi:hypothetical protein